MLKTSTGHCITTIGLTLAVSYYYTHFSHEDFDLNYRFGGATNVSLSLVAGCTLKQTEMCQTIWRKKMTLLSFNIPL